MCAMTHEHGHAAGVVSTTARARALRWCGGSAPLSLALAMTEKHEKAERARIMQERGCSELDAVHVVAERIAAQRGD